jgi:hypothetical protein
MLFTSSLMAEYVSCNTHGLDHADARHSVRSPTCDVMCLRTRKRKMQRSTSKLRMLDSTKRSCRS